MSAWRHRKSPARRPPSWRQQRRERKEAARRHLAATDARDLLWEILYQGHGDCTDPNWTITAGQVAWGDDGKISGRHALRRARAALEYLNEGGHLVPTFHYDRFGNIAGVAFRLPKPSDPDRGPESFRGPGPR